MGARHTALGSARGRTLPDLIAAAQLDTGNIRIDLNTLFLAKALDIAADDICAEAATITAAFSLRRRGVELKIFTGERDPHPDPVMLRTLAKAHRWAQALRTGTPLHDLARREHVSESYLRTRAQLAFLSPSIQQAILAGRQPTGLTVKRLIAGGVPLDWAEQDRKYNFRAPSPLP